MAGKSEYGETRNEKAQPRARTGSGGSHAQKLDRLIHERLRLGILSALSVNDSLKFNELKKLLDTTDGNLSVHARKLEEAGYVACAKSFEGRMPKTEYKLTRSRQARAGKISGSHGSPDPSHAGKVSLFLCPNNFAAQSTLHTGIIMDGNGRWALARGMPRVAGHRAGVETVTRVVEAAPKLESEC